MPVGPAGWEGVLCTQGPFSRNARDLEEYMRVILDSKPWERDPTYVTCWSDKTNVQPALPALA